jgi:glycosyltransferase involved in cell wall biosynthesis
VPEGWLWHPDNTVDLAGEPVLVLCFDDDTPPPPVSGAGPLLSIGVGNKELSSLVGVFGDSELKALAPKTAIVNTLNSATVLGILGARRHGVRTFYLVESPGSWLQSNTRGALALAANYQLRRAISKLPLLPGLIERTLRARLSPPWPSSEATERATQIVVERTLAESAPAPAPPFRVEHMIGSLGPGGAERQLTYLAKGAKAEGHDVSVLTNSLAGAGSHYLPDLQAAGVPAGELLQFGYHQLLPDLRDISPFAERELLESHCDRATLFALVKALRARRPDVLHCWLNQANTTGALGGLVAGVPRILLSVRSVNPSHIPHLSRPWLRSAYRSLSRSPRVRFVANSQCAAESYATWAEIPLDRFTVIRNGFPLEHRPAPSAADRAVARRGFGITDDAFVIAGVLRTSEEKCPLDFVRVVAKVRDQIPTVRALHAGTGPLQETVLREATRLGLDDTLTFLGQLSDLGPLQAACDVGVLTSRVESCPNVLLEFQAAERPVVLTRAGGAPETVRDGETGLIAEIGDVDGLAAHVLDLAQDPARAAAMGKAGRPWIKEHFSVDAMIRETLRLYGDSGAS